VTTATKPRELAILMHARSIEGIQAGRKRQTRRIVKPQPNSGPRGRMVDLGAAWGLLDGVLSGEWCCPYGQPGDLLWVRETWAVRQGWDDVAPRDLDAPYVWYRANESSERSEMRGR